MSNLGRWLRYQIYGVWAKPHPVRHRKYRGNDRRNWRYRQWIRTMPCAACGSTRFVEAAHTGSHHGMRQKAPDKTCVPLCSNCHRIGPRSYHRIGKAAFELLWSLEFVSLVERLNLEWEGR